MPSTTAYESESKRSGPVQAVLCPATINTAYNPASITICTGDSCSGTLPLACHCSVPSHVCPSEDTNRTRHHKPEQRGLHWAT
eukprot:1330879-Amphidinium_carterae.1